MRLILVRHAPTAQTGGTLTGRLPGVALSPAGIDATNARAEQLADLRIDAVATSPVQRCRETAKILAAAWGHAPRVDTGFNEVDFGDWSGRTLRSLSRLKAWQRLMTSPARFGFPGGETFLDLRSRVVGATEKLAGSHRKKRVVVVSHADTIRAVLGHYMGAPLDLIHRLDVRPLSASIIDLPDDGSAPRVPVVNSLDALVGY